jgi:sec-independent protein translocase protein TatB
MMPGIGFQEMILLVLVAIVVIGPKDLPLMMRKFGRFSGRMRSLAWEFRQGFDELGRQAELEELKREVADLKKATGLADVQGEFENDRRAMEEDYSRAMDGLDGRPPAASPATPVLPAPVHPSPGPMALMGAAAAPTVAEAAATPAPLSGVDEDPYRIGAPVAVKQDSPA